MFEANGVDVSSYQPTIDWFSVKAACYHYAYVKATEGVTYINPFYFQQMNGARDAGLVVGAYHFYHPNVDPLLQADYFMKNAGTNPDWMPAALDIEVRSGESPQQFLFGIAKWLEMVAVTTKKQPVIYCSPSFWMELGNPTNFDQHPLWIAEYNASAPKPVGSWGVDGWAIWQHTSTGKVPGIPGDIDVSIYRPERLGFALP